MDWFVCTTAETEIANCAHWRQWQEFYLWRKGVQLQKGLQLVPQTSNLISTLPEAASMVKWHTLTVAETVFRQLHTHRWIQLCLSYWPLQSARVLSIMCYRWLGRWVSQSWIQALRSVRILAQRMPGFGCISGLMCPKGQGSRLDHELKGIYSTSFIFIRPWKSTLAAGLKVAALHLMMHFSTPFGTMALVLGLYLLLMWVSFNHQWFEDFCNGYRYGTRRWLNKCRLQKSWKSLMRLYANKQFNSINIGSEPLRVTINNIQAWPDRPTVSSLHFIRFNFTARSMCGISFLEPVNSLRRSFKIINHLL